ncbi:MAG TPA: substrate-binding domain-containing protein [Ktedonobacterales bacterium]|nr:substrate-binding domain-containing protein [Ktedonobacterales bacterium]
MRARIHTSSPAARRRLQLLSVLVPILALAACGGNSGAGWGPGSTAGNSSTNHIVQQGGLIIFAAPTLQQVLPALTAAFFKARHLAIPYTFNFSGDQVNANTANTLADADLLIVDNKQTLIDARNLGFARSTGTPLATDTLSVILPASNPGKIHTLQDLARPGLRYLGVSPEDGLSAQVQATLESMILDPAFGPDYSARVYGNLYQNYTDGPAATQALMASPPPGDFSIVYHTNFLDAQRQHTSALRELPIPSQFNPPLDMLAALASQANNPGLSQQFIDFMRSAQSQMIWKQYGFQPPT